MKKKYSKVYIMCIIIGLLTGLCSYMLFKINEPELSAVISVFTFLFLWAPQMMPDSDKYDNY
jgi:hypothetical protein